MKFIIAGAGISGIANFLWLKKLLPASFSAEIIILEAYKEPALTGGDGTTDLKPAGASHIGAGLGLGPNGLRTLKSLDLEIYTAMRRSGYPVMRHQLKTSRGATLGAANSSFEGEPCQLMMRQDVWDALRAKVPDDAIRWNSKITQVAESTDGRIEVHLQDGSVEMTDVLIGADGVRSNVRTFVVGDAFPAHYEGLVGVGGTYPSSALPPLPPDRILHSPNSPSVMTFGPQGFVGYAPVSQGEQFQLKPSENTSTDVVPSYGPTALWWSTYELENDPGTGKIDVEAIRAQLIERHGAWADKSLVEFISKGGICGLWPTYIVENLPSYNKGCVLLTGDAAHAMPPSSGQGVSQALEDAQALALLLAHYIPKTTDTSPSTLSANREAIEHAFAKFTALRKPRNDKIIDFARKMGNKKRKQGFIEEWITYGFIWLFTKFPSASSERDLFGYDVEKAVQDIIAVS